jgi:DNA-binding transcriptional regulator YiaG
MAETAMKIALSSVAPCDAGRVIRSWRQRIGLTQKGLAKALSVTFSTVSRWENGRVKPSKLAWCEMARLAAERNCPLVEADAWRGVGASVHVLCNRAR